MTEISRDQYEETLLKEIRDLPESELRKILKLIHFLKEEIFGGLKTPQNDLQSFWNSFGSWEDERGPEEIINEIYSSRRSTSREIRL
ncbi:MAG: hypothetical protein Q8O04_03480 [Deltaproteobacteria bacterium]|nr:hypothetical protein [Deltaproteobacteria bacterium]